MIPARVALSMSAPVRCVRRHVVLTRRFWRRPALRSVIPFGSPTTRVPTRRATAQATTVLAASWWARRILAMCLRSASRCASRSRRHRRLPRSTSTRRLPAHAGVAPLGVLKVEAFLRPQRTTGHDQGVTIGSHRRERVDDAHIYPRHSTGIESKGIDRDYRAHIHEEPPEFADQSDGPHRAQVVRDLAGETHPQLGLTPGHRQAQPAPVQRKGRESETHWSQRPLPAWVAGPPARPLSTGGLEAGQRILLGHILGADPRQGPKIRSGQLPTQRGKPEHRRPAPHETGSVELDQPRPHIARSPQQPEATPTLCWRHPQLHPCRPQHPSIHTNKCTDGV